MPIKDETFVFKKRSKKHEGANVVQKKSPITFFSVAELIPSKEKLTIANIFTNFRSD